MKVYTMKDWATDVTFNAADWQEVSADIYNEMFTVLPPLRLKDAQGCTAGFRVGEAYTHINGKPVYRAFGKKGDKYYYLGLQ